MYISDFASKPTNVDVKTKGPCAQEYNLFISKLFDTMDQMITVVLVTFTVK